MSIFIEQLNELANSYKSNKEFAEAWGVHPNQLSDYLRGKRDPKAEILSRLADNVKCDLHKLLTGQSYKSPEAEEMDKKDREHLAQLSETIDKLLEELKRIEKEQREFRLRLKALEGNGKVSE